MTTFNNVIFVGGIHGVGKSSLCLNICHELNIKYLSASELLKWSELNEDPKNKKVASIPDTQTRLILGLQKAVRENDYYLLDGHYCLLNKENVIVQVPLDTFKQINPKRMVLILGDITEVKKGLEARDNKLYNLGLLKSLQNEELAYAQHLSKTLSVELIKGTKNDYSAILNSLRMTL